MQDSIDGDELEDQEFGQEIEGIAYDGTSSRLRIERTIGEGPESVYLYYHDVHAEFAATKGLFVWECKIGRTIGEPNARIIGQGALTCFPRPPIVGLLIRTHDGRSTEALLHSALVLAGRRIDQGGGSEWFLTSPDRVSDWFSACLASISILSSNATREPGASSTTSSIPNLSEPS